MKNFAQQREEMVKNQLLGRGISDEAVLEAMRKVSRHLFVPEHLRSEAYADTTISVGPDQIISPPYIIALMLESARLTPGDHVLEIGTGSGYEAALIGEISKAVYTIELDPTLMAATERRLKGLGYDNVYCRSGNGWNGWPEVAPFDAIIVTGATAEIPRDLVKQLAPGGRMILPLGEAEQQLVFLERGETGLLSQDLGQVRFAPLRSDDSHH
ncbi:MAG: protein-L-isoaspartate(D-aspartate) O-methyltransferase [Deltaproteobacteria bacterium]|nr:protein-L-isoaspartate(D-aspartate) O-methyltransferase [Deltaproteobacteria bacterium]